MRTKRSFALAVSAILFFSSSTWAAENQSSVSSSIGVNARYEIVQSELVAKATFRVDRVCGIVSQMVSAPNGRTLWQPIPMEDKPTCTADARIRYQLFSSGLTVRYTYLMNTDNGTTWVLVADSNENLVWQKMP